MNNIKKIFLVILTVLFGFANHGQAMEFDDFGGIDVHGFISQGFLQSDENNFFADTEDGTTQFNEMGINFSTDVTDKLRLGVQFFARDMGDIGNNEVKLDWAIADYRWRDWMGVRAGNMKWVNGLYNESRDVDMLRTPIFLPQGVYNEAWRETSANLQGVGFYGEIPASKAGSVSYDLQYGSMSMPVDGGPAKLLKDQVPGTLKDIFAISDVDLTEVDVEFTYTSAVKWNTPLEGLVIGATHWGYNFDAHADTLLDVDTLNANAQTGLGAYSTLQTLATNAGGYTNLPAEQQALYLQAAGMAPFYQKVIDSTTADPSIGEQMETYPTDFTVEARTLTGSVEYTWDNLVFAAEYMQTTYNIEMQNLLWANIPSATGGSAYPFGKIVVPEFDAVGYYGSLSYRFTYWFELGVYYSEYYRNKDDKDGEKRIVSFPDEPKHRAWLKDTCLTTRFDINENWVLKLEGHIMNGTAVIYGDDNPVPVNPNEDRYEEDWFLGAAKITYSF